MSVNKEIPITERVLIHDAAGGVELLNHPFFDIANSSPTSNTFGLITGAKQQHAHDAVPCRH